jgi:hypothetical protein
MMTGTRCPVPPLNRRTIRDLGVACAILLLSFSPDAGAVSLDRMVHFDIPPNTMLDEALAEWSAQADVQSISASIPSRLTEGIQGTYSAREVLELLLKESGLRYEVDADTVLIKPARRDNVQANKSSGAGPWRPPIFPHCGPVETPAP